MKTLMLTAICSALLLTGCQKEEGGATEEKPAEPATTAPEKSSAIVPAEAEVMLASFEGTTLELGCGRCIYKMDGVQGCPAAAVVNGKPVLIKGVGQSAHEHGLCTKSSMAMVTGEIEDGHLVTTKIEIQ